MFNTQEKKLQKKETITLLLVFIVIFSIRYLTLDSSYLESIDNRLFNIFVKNNLYLLFILLFAGNIVLALYLFKILKEIREPMSKLADISENILNKKINMMFQSKEKMDVKELSKSLETMKLNLKRQHKVIYRLSYRDTLTGLLNRKGFYEVFESMLAKGKKDYVLLLLDIDDFKVINDTLGHDTGDIVLENFSRSIIKSVPKNSLIARLGGDEFVIVFRHSKHNKLEDMLKKIMNNLSVSANLSEKDYELTCSVGASLSRDLKEISISNLLKNADIAMYASKENGKNTYTIFTENLREELVEEITQTKELLRAMENNEFFMVYHPLYDTEKEKIWGLESLIRWDHPQNGIIYPSDFISHMEKIGLSYKLAEFVIGQACNKLKTLDPKIKISINISGELFNSYDFYKMYASIIEKSDIDPKQIILEVTEDSLIDLNSNTVDIFNKIGSLGSEIWIDDFGTGYSSLAYLKELPIRGVKIDKSFLKDVETCIQSYNLLDGIIKLATSLNLEIIVEGIETKEQYDILKRLKCKMIQGFYICKPKNFSDMKDFIDLVEKETHLVLSKDMEKRKQV